MFMVPISNPHLKRTIRPLYAHHQATTWAGFLDPDLPAGTEILPGTVMARKSGEVFTPYTGEGSGLTPFGLSAFFFSSALGVDEVTDSGSNTFTCWVGDGTALFEVLAPAFDTSATWTQPTDGSVVLLTGNDEGKLTPEGATAANAIGELVEVVSSTKITVRPFRPIPA